MTTAPRSTAGLLDVLHRLVDDSANYLVSVDAKIDELDLRETIAACRERARFGHSSLERSVRMNTIARLSNEGLAIDTQPHIHAGIGPVIQEDPHPRTAQIRYYVRISWNKPNPSKL